MSDRFGSITISSEKKSPEPKKTEQPPPHRPRPPKKQQEKQRGVLLFSLVAALLVALYFSAGTYLVPALAKKYLPAYLHKTTGLELSFASIQLNPLNFQLTIKQIQTRLPGSATSKPLLQTESLFMDLDLTSLLRNGFVCDSLKIKGLELNLIRFQDNSYNLPPLFHFSEEQKTGEIMNFAQLPFLFSLNNIDISDSRILFKDMLTNKTHSVEQLHLAVPSFSNFSFQSQNYIQPHFSAIINGSPIQLSGEAVQVAQDHGFQTKLSCTIESLDLVPYFSYLPPSFPLTLSRGRADTSLQIYFSPQKKQGSRLSIDFKMTANDIAIQSKDEALELVAPALKMDGSLEPFAKRLHVKNIVVREPQISTPQGHLAEYFQRLLPQTPSTGNTQAQLAIDLALADHGRLVLKPDKTTPSKDLTWKGLQLSIKNFRTAGWSKQQQETASGTFRLSGEMEKEQGSFSWQGKIKGTKRISGKLLLNEFPAAPLFTLLAPPEGEKIKGSATFSGDLALFPRQKESANYSLSNGTLQFHHLKLSHGKKQWLQTEAVRLTRLSRTDGRFNLGNIFLEGANLTLNSSDLPPFWKQVSAKKEPLQLAGIDFSGTLHIKTKAKSAPALQLNDFRFQANNLDQPVSKAKPTSTENFALSATLSPQGVIKAKGSLSLAPLQLTTQLAFSDVSSSLLAPFFTDWTIWHYSKSTLHGKGLYHFPEPSFQGNLRLTDTTLQDSRKSSLLHWKLAEFNKVDCRFSPFHLKAETLLIDTPQIQWQRQENSVSPFQQALAGFKAVFHNRAGEKSTGKTQFLPVNLNEITLQNGSLTYLDKRLSPHWQPVVEKIEGRLKNLDSTATGSSPFNLSGTVDKAAFSVSGALTLFSAAPSGKATLQLTDFPLASFHNQLASLPVNTDSASLNLLYEFTEEPSFFNSSAKMTIKNLTPTSAASDTALTLALLKDKKGTFPLTIQTKENSRPLLQESMNNFQTTVIKASYAPLLLDQEFADLQESDFVSFQAGSDKLNTDAQKILLRYVKLLEKHPSLALSITGLADRENDQRILQENLERNEQQRVDKENAKRKAEYLEKQKSVAALSTSNTLQEENMAKEELAKYVPILPNQVEVSDDELLYLARERTLLIQNFFSRALVNDFFTRSLATPSTRIVAAEEGKIIETGVGNRVFIALKAMPLTEQNKDGGQKDAALELQ